MVVLLDGGGLGDWLVKGFADELPEVDDFPRCFCYGIIFSLACG
jgi:hypothetical protein